MTNKTIGQPAAHTDGAFLISAGISVGSVTSTKILDAEIIAEGQQPERMLVAVSVLGKDIFLKMQPAATDNDKKGVFIPQNSTAVFEVENMYFGEMSAIAIVSTATVYVTVL